MQGNYTDMKTTGTPDLELDQLDNTEETSECQRSAFRMNQSTAKKTCLPKRSRKVLLCQHCDYTTTNSVNLKTHSRKHTGDMLQCKDCDYTTVRYGDLKRHSRKHTGE